MVHVLSAEWGWLSRCGGPERGPRLNLPITNGEISDGSLEPSRTIFSRVLVDVEDEDLARKMLNTMNDRAENSHAIGELMQHTANHGAHHRDRCAAAKIARLRAGQF